MKQEESTDEKVKTTNEPTTSQEQQQQQPQQPQQQQQQEQPPPPNIVEGTVNKETVKTEANTAEEVGTNITICHDEVKHDDSDVIVLESTETKPTLMHSESTGDEPMEE